MATISAKASVAKFLCIFLARSDLVMVSELGAREHGAMHAFERAKLRPKVRKAPTPV